MKHKKLIIAGLVLCVAIGALAYAAFTGSIDYYNSVGELKAEGIVDKTVKVRGVVMEGTVEFNSDEGDYVFVIYDEDNEAETLTVVYNEPSLPDAFDEGKGVVAQGKLSEDDRFLASSLIVSCPSKYQAEE